MLCIPDTTKNTRNRRMWSCFICEVLARDVRSAEVLGVDVGLESVVDLVAGRLFDTSRRKISILVRFCRNTNHSTRVQTSFKHPYLAKKKKKTLEYPSVRTTTTTTPSLPDIFKATSIPPPPAGRLELELHLGTFAPSYIYFNISKAMANRSGVMAASNPTASSAQQAAKGSSPAAKPAHDGNVIKRYTIPPPLPHPYPSSKHTH